MRQTIGMSQSESVKQKFRWSLRVWLLLVSVILFAILNLIVYSGSMAVGPLLDEQYFIGRLGQESSQAQSLISFCLSFKGFVYGDTSGPLAGLLHVTLLKSLASLRFFGLLMHWLNAVLVVAVVSHGSETREKVFFGFICGLIFLLYPLTAETIFYMGGATYSFSTACFLISFLFFLEARRKLSIALLGVASVFFALCVMFDRSSWISSFVFLTYEIMQMIFKHAKNADANLTPSNLSQEEDDAVDRLLELESARASGKEETTDAETAHAESKSVLESQTANPFFDGLLPILPFVLIGCIVPLGALPNTGSETLSKDVMVNWQDWLKAFQVLFLPVNWNHFTGTSRYYTFLCCLYAVPLLSLIGVLARHKHLRINFGWLVLWILVTLVPHLHAYTHSVTFGGVRWFYHCLVPLSAVLALAFVSPYLLVRELLPKMRFIKALAFIASGALLIVYVIYISSLCFKDMHNFRSGARQTKVFQDSIKNLAEREKFDYVLVRNVPDIVSVHPTVSLFSLGVYDGKTALMKAPEVSGGKLKKLLDQQLSKYKAITSHFEPDYKGIVTCDMMKTTPENTLRNAYFLEALTPPLKYWRTGTYDDAINEFTLFSNNEFRPTVSFQVNSISNVNTDFVYIDARITAPKSSEGQAIDMGYTTSWCNDLEPRDRYMKVKAFINDDQFHRYYFPTDTTAWLTNGYIKQLTFSFPSCSKVTIKDLGTTQTLDQKPLLDIDLTHAKAQNKPEIKDYTDPFCHKFEPMSELGLCYLSESEKAIKLTFDASKIKDAKKVGLEYTLCKPGTHFSPHFVDSYDPAATGKKIVDATSGSIDLSVTDLEKPGFYALRLFAENGSGKTVGLASDTIYCLAQFQKGAKK
ncbi:MAG: hypothetical protein IPG59_03355 [Candidatus Melainabacteria bacterium]|nr:MAG: hypothetical protein IPG59_03355 [Candidatus Melainabacteria bacterium]